MSGALLVLTHPAVPLAWWAANSPPVVSLVSQALGAVGEGARRLADDEEEHEEQQQQIMFIAIGTAVGILVPIFVWLVIASMYKGKVTDKRGPFPQQVENNFSMAGGDFRYGLFGCCEDFQYFLHGCCAGTIRAADTFQTVNATGYWMVAFAFLFAWFAAQVIGIGITLGLQELPNLTGSMQMARMSRGRMMNQAGQIGWFCASAFLALWLAGLRKKLRAKLGDPKPDGSFMPDCCKYWWCNCCAVVQDARQVDGAQGVRVECCCNVVKTMPESVNVGESVGGPVVVGQVVA